MGIGLRLALSLSLFAALAAAAPAATPCTEQHPCHHVFRVGPTGSRTAHVAWDSKQLFPQAPIAIQVTYSPHLAFDRPIQIDPVGDCALHFAVAARFTGFATHCGTGMVPLHLQVANVYRKHLRVGIYYWLPVPMFAG